MFQPLSVGRRPAEIDLVSVANLRKALRYAARRQQPLLILDGHRLMTT